MKSLVLIARGLAVALVLSIFALPEQVAIAQDVGDDDALEEVVVTGSRIRQNPLEARTPVQILTADDVNDSGAIGIGDFLQRLPISGSAINRANNASGNLGFPPDGGGIGAGASEIDLRYLSSKRVLVLVDGHRWVRGSSASGVSGAVDLNTIPVNAIKRVEVLQDGASTIYGSDAIAGVVNIITQDNYDGLNVSAYYGTFDEGDGESQEYNLSFGAEGDNARIFVAASYTDQGDVSAADRDISTYPIAGVPIGASSGTPQGRVIFDDPRDGIGTQVDLTLNDGILNDGGANIPVYDFTDPTGGDFHAFALADRFNYQPFNHLVTPNERVNIFLKGEYDLAENILFRLTAAFNNRTSQNKAAPEPLFAGPGGGGGAWMEGITFHVNNPYNPFGISFGPNEIGGGFVTRRPLEAGPRVFDHNVDTWHIATTLEGELELNAATWYWDAHVSWAQNQANQIKHGAFNARKVSVAVGDPAICAVNPGCVPFNWFGGQGPDGSGSITQDMLDYVTFVQKDESEQEMLNFSANISGDLFEMPAGALSVAAGVEYRDEEGFFIPDSVVSGGETAGIPASPTIGAFDVTSLYAEAVVPIIENFDVSAAVRYSDYDLSGSATVFKTGLSWRPTDAISLRANFSEGFRAPNIGELFNTGSRFDSTINDPCDADLLAADPSLQPNCITLGVPVGSQQLNPQISVSTGGNTSLTPEDAETWTVGFTWDASELVGIAGFTVEANYYDIQVENAIQAPNASDVLLQCVQTLNPLFCDNVTRVGPTVTRIEGILQNIGGIETNGFDWSITAVFDTSSAGQFRVKWSNTHLLDYTEITTGPSGDVRTERAGTELGSPERGFVEWKSTLGVDWSRNDWTVGMTNRYLSSITERCSGLVADFGFTNLCTNGSATPATNEIDSTIYVDFRVTWSPSNADSWTFQGGVQNAFDEDTPICFSCDLNSFDGTLFPVSGQFYYARISYEL